MTKADFERLMARLGDAWNAGDAMAAAACFADTVDYADPVRYRFTSRDELLPFFDPGPHGHAVEWHRLLFDEAARTGVVEYTYRGHHRYHGAAIIDVGDDGRISAWREWQHTSDEDDWAAFLRRPCASSAGDRRRQPPAEAGGSSDTCREPSGSGATSGRGCRPSPSS